MKLKTAALATLIATTAIASLPNEASAFGSTLALRRVIIQEMGRLGDRIQGYEQQGRQLLTQHGQNNSDHATKNLAAEANMRALEDERRRQAQIQQQTFEAGRRSAFSASECIVRTRVTYSADFNRSDLMISEATLNTLEKMAAWNTGHPIGGSGAPIQVASKNEKEGKFLKDMAGKYCDPSLVENNLCPTEEIVSEELQGAPYTAAKSIFSSINFASPEIEEACSLYFSQNVAGEASMGVESEAKSDGSLDAQREASAVYTDSSRKSISQSVIARACMARSPSLTKNSEFMKRVKETAEHVPGFSKNELEEKGVSVMMADQIISKEFYFRPKQDEKEEVKTLNDIYRVLGWMAYQNNKLYEKVDELTVVSAGTLGAVNELVNLQREGMFTAEIREN